MIQGAYLCLGLSDNWTLGEVVANSLVHILLLGLLFLAFPLGCEMVRMADDKARKICYLPALPDLPFTGSSSSLSVSYPGRRESHSSRPSSAYPSPLSSITKSS